MEATIAVFNSHHQALEAAKMLVNEGFPMKKISLVGKAEIVDDQVKIKHHDPLVKAPVEVGVVVGAVLGLLTGVGVFAIPGLGFLYGAGAIVGALGGFDFGLITGGLVSVFASLGLKDDDAFTYHEHVKEGKFLLIFNGTEEEVDRASALLNPVQVLNPAEAHVET